MDDILQGGRDDLSGYRGRAGFTTFARIFTGSFLCVVFLCLLVFCLFFVLFVCFWLPAGEKTPASNSSFTLFAFAYFESWPTMPHARSAMQEKKRKKNGDGIIIGEWIRRISRFRCGFSQRKCENLLGSMCPEFEACGRAQLRREPNLLHKLKS